jgi:hypothetical protein
VSARRLIAQLLRARDPGLLVLGLVCGVVAAALVAAPLGWAAAGVSFVAMDLATGDRGDES